MSKAVTVCLVLVGIINLMPVVGVLSAQKLESAYDIRLLGNDLIILMRHRALLFGVLGSFILYAAFYPMYQAPAMLMAAVSMIGYVVLVLLVGNYNSSLFKILIVDLVGIVLLLIATIFKYAFKNN